MFDEAATKNMIDDEVRRFAERRGWRWQLRRDWKVREKPVDESDIFDYEWKLIPWDTRSRQDVSRDLRLGDTEFVEGWYYVLRLRDEVTLEFIHDNDWSPGHGMGGWWSNQHTCTVMRLSAIRRLSETDRVLQSDWGIAAPPMGAQSPSGPQRCRAFVLGQSRDSGSGTDVRSGSVALSNWLVIMTDRHGPNFYSVT